MKIYSRWLQEHQRPLLNLQSLDWNYPWSVTAFSHLRNPIKGTHTAVLPKPSHVWIHNCEYNNNKDDVVTGIYVTRTLSIVILASMSTSSSLYHHRSRWQNDLGFLPQRLINPTVCRMCLAVTGCVKAWSFYFRVSSFSTPLYQQSLNLFDVYILRSF